MLSSSVPPRTLMGIVGGSGVPNRRRVTPVGNVTPVVVVHADDVPVDVAPVICAPLPLRGRSALVAWRSSTPTSAVLMSSSMSSSCVMMFGLLTSSKFSSRLTSFATHWFMAF